MKQSIITSMLGAALAFAPAVFAQDAENKLAGGYIGIAGGQFHEDSPPAPPGYRYSDDDNAGAFRFYGGYRWENGGALEASLNGVGDLKLDCSAFTGAGGQQTVERASFSVVGLYHLQLGGRFSVFPKLGLAYAEVDSGNNACVTYSDDSAVSVVFGAGAEFRIVENIAFRADIDKGTSGLDDEKFAWTAGLSFYF